MAFDELAGMVTGRLRTPPLMDDSVVSDGPDAATAGPFLRLTLGRWK